jgi:DNA polymerase-3 subunit gamma/tau
VCKDEKSANLLEVVESFKDRYIATAKKVSPVLLISALNILNDAEINYKAARNKRLHAELALIKLCYLQQAIQLSSDTNGIAKKKIVEGTLAFRTSAIKPFSGSSAIVAKTSGNKTEAKLIIETSAINEDVPVYHPATITSKQQSSEPLVTSTQQPVTGNKLSALDKIRKQYQGNGNNGNSSINHALEYESLQKAWAEYVVKLKEAKNPAAQPFELALLRIKDENSFEAVTANNIEQKFIEQERNKLFAFLQELLQNRLLQFNVTIEEKAEDRPVIEIPLNSKEQFQKMVEQYPLVKELKDRLRLELDY